MSQPNFHAMSQKELHNYVLAHREDQETFYAYIDRLPMEGNWIEMPVLQSEQDLENHPEFTKHIRKSSERRNNAS